MYKKILVPLDGSKLAEAPLDYAVWLASKSGAELQLMHVYSGRALATAHYLERKTAEIVRDNEFHCDIPVEVKPVVARGDPASEILKYTEDNSIDLITMSTHGHTGVRRWLMGSVADKVVRYSNRPVRLVKSFSDRPTCVNGYDAMVLALLDGSEMAEQVLPYAAYHARTSGGELVLFSVCEPPEILPEVTYHFIPHDYPPRYPLQWDKYVEQETQRRQRECHLYLEKVSELENGIRVRAEAPFGNTVEEITRYLENNPVDLVAMTTRGRSGLSRWVFGSVAEKVLAASPAPVLIIRPGESGSG